MHEHHNRQRGHHDRLSQRKHRPRGRNSKVVHTRGICGPVAQERDVQFSVCRAGPELADVPQHLDAGEHTQRFRGWVRRDGPGGQGHQRRHYCGDCGLHRCGRCDTGWDRHLGEEGESAHGLVEDGGAAGHAADGEGRQDRAKVKMLVIWVEEVSNV